MPNFEQMNLWKFQQVLARETMIYLGLKTAPEGRPNLGAGGICIAVSYLLAEHLVFDPIWDSRRRWIDRLIDTEVALLTKRSVHLCGNIAWGMNRDIGGEQWAEPFEAALALTEGNIVRYAFWFGDQRKKSRKRIQLGKYSLKRKIIEPQIEGATVDVWRPWQPIGYLHQFAGEVSFSERQ